MSLGDARHTSSDFRETHRQARLHESPDNASDVIVRTIAVTDPDLQKTGSGKGGYFLTLPGGRFPG